MICVVLLLLQLQKILKNLLINLQARGCGILLTDHNAAQLLSVVDRAYIIANGAIIANGTPRQIVNATVAREKYFGENLKG